ncbi:tyrosine-type recombinase/integrase [Vibrio makurazakiensis]|uniref:tyrosine-type recombinase/integrase n=1 Tax=Vibrio makurazakiensis TaxID=2910250 RepID=UPI003D1360C5
MKKNVAIFTDQKQVKELTRNLCRSSELEYIQSLAQNHYSHNSLLAMYSDWKNYLEFCQSHHINPLPASVTAIRRFLQIESSKRKFASLKRYTATFGFIHTVLGYANPVNHRQVQLTLAELRIQKHGDAKQTSAFTLSHLNDLNFQLSRSDNIRDIRDRAIYNVMFECVLKRSELRELKFESVIVLESGNLNILIGDNSYALSTHTSEFLSAWLKHSEATAGPVFRSIDRHGNISNQTLNDSSIYRILRNASSLLGLAEQYKFSGQSLRVGAAKELSKQGMKVNEIQDLGRWLSPAMPSQYIGRKGNAAIEMSKFKAIKGWD